MAAKTGDQNKSIQHGNFFERNEKLLTYILGGLLVVGLGVFGYMKFIREPKDIESQEAWWPAFNFIQADSFDLALNGSMEHSGLIEVADKYDGYSGADIANYLAGVAYLQKGEYQNAIDALGKCEFEDHILVAKTKALIGDAFSELGEYQAAADHYLEASDLFPNELDTPIYLKKAGIHLEEVGDLSGAKSAYERIRDEFPNTRSGQNIERYIARVSK